MCTQSPSTGSKAWVWTRETLETQSQVTGTGLDDAKIPKGRINSFLLKIFILISEWQDLKQKPPLPFWHWVRRKLSRGSLSIHYNESNYKMTVFIKDCADRLEMNFPFPHLSSWEKDRVARDESPLPIFVGMGVKFGASPWVGGVI